jgi:hypothetical protein
MRLNNDGKTGMDGRIGLNEREWFRLPEACRYSGIKRSHFWELAVAEGHIRSFVLKQRSDALRGVRLFSRRSIDEFLEKRALEAELAQQQKKKPKVRSKRI